MKKPLRVVFWGTPDLGIPVVKALYSSSDFELVAVVSQPDKPQGRKHQLLPTPIKQCAEELGVPVFQPEKLQREEVLTQLRSYNADFFVVMAYGKIVRQEILDIPKIAPVNIHVSLLPKHRGASPIQASLLAGDSETGVTFMRMTAGMDEGPVIAQFSLPIHSSWHAGDVFKKLAELSQKHVCKVLTDYAAGHRTEVEQDIHEVTHCTKISKEMGQVDWSSWDTDRLYRAWQAYTPWPGVYSFIDGKRVKLLQMQPVASELLKEWTSEAMESSDGSLQVGSLHRIQDHILVVTLSGLVELSRLQTEGKKPLAALEWFRGLTTKQFDV